MFYFLNVIKYWYIDLVFWLVILLVRLVIFLKFALLFRYILVEPDKHVVGREKWDECEFTAGKPIPGLFYRVYLCPQVALSLSDRGNNELL